MEKLKLNEFYYMIKSTILKNQNSISGLIPASDTNKHAWVRDNCYAVLSVWGLSLAYRKIPDLDEDRTKGYELEKCAIKLMRGLLTCFMKQSEKVEAFKNSQRPSDSLHAKFDSETCNAVVGDYGWGHLQIDAISFYLLTIAQMTASGLHIIWTLDEVAFIQNLVFYIEMAYRIPDYGIWERGDKTNHGLPELNTSSVGMAKAALEALSELDLFGPHGGPQSVIQVFPDETQQCNAVLESMLPRESYSKELDSGLISVISYPAFAVNDDELIEKTRNEILTNLLGKYGCKRFLRDGFKTPKEDPHRLHYEPHELRVFEKIECDWPMFLAYLALDACFRDEFHLAKDYIKKLESVLVTLPSGYRAVPELYAVTLESMELELQNPGSQKREPKGKIPQIWGQSLYILAKLVTDSIITPGEIDPLGRRMLLEPKSDLVVQIAVIVENQEMKRILKKENIISETSEELFQESGIKVFPARTLTFILKTLGKCNALKLQGRVCKEVGILATSRLYLIGKHMIAFQPQFMDTKDFYVSMDYDFIVDLFRTNVAYLRRVWSNPGRPTLILPMFQRFFKSDGTIEKSIHTTLMKLNSGYIYGTRVKLGKLMDFVSTSFVTKLSFLHERGDDVVRRLNPNPTSPKKIDLIRQSSVSHDNPVFKSLSMRRKSLALTNAILADLEGQDNLNSFDSNDSAMQRWITGKSPDEINTEEYGTLKPSNLLKFGSKEEVRSNTSHLKSLASQYQTIKSIGDQSSWNSQSNDDLLEQLLDTNDISEQAEILFILWQREGLDWVARIDEETYTIKQMLIELYEKAGEAHEWWLVRFIAGLLNKKMDILAKSLTDLLVRQKHVTVGLPPEPREIVISTPMNPNELAEVIKRACVEDYAMMMLTQEVLVYLAMFARSEPQLLAQMLRIRVGLIIQVMASELGRALNCSASEASNKLYDLSPSQMKLLLQHILAGREFAMATRKRLSSSTSISSILARRERRKSGIQTIKPVINIAAFEGTLPEEDKEINLDDTSSRVGQWIRRRKIDGALNRVPSKFYQKLWKVMERTQEIRIANRSLGNYLTKEMTQGEIKFALEVENIINCVPIPEYRQMIVEAFCVLSSLVELDTERKIRLDFTISMEHVIIAANSLFLVDQLKFNGDATLCCARNSTDLSKRKHSISCKGSQGVCIHFYDTSPSGRYGTMTYLLRAFVDMIRVPNGKIDESCIDCQVQ